MALFLDNLDAFPTFSILNFSYYMLVEIETTDNTIIAIHLICI